MLFICFALDITVTAPDYAPPRIIESHPVDGAIDVNPDKLREIVLKFNELINVFHDIIVAFEPPHGINAAGEPTQIKSYLSYNGYPYNVSKVIVYWSKDIRLAHETNYTITLGNIMDLADNSRGETITFKTASP